MSSFGVLKGTISVIQLALGALLGSVGVAQLSDGKRFHGLSILELSLSRCEAGLNTLSEAWQQLLRYSLHQAQFCKMAYMAHALP